VASSCIGTRCPWLPRLGGLLSPIHPRLWRHRCASHRAAQEGFFWNPDAEQAFRTLQHALTEAPVLQLPAFDRDFVVECDASGSGFSAVLHQGGGPVAFFSKQIAPRHTKLAAYERELIGLVQAVRHWRPYLWGRRFIVRTDHHSLRFLLDQRLTTIPQH